MRQSLIRAFNLRLSEQQNGFPRVNAGGIQPDWRIGLAYAADLNFLGLLIEPFQPTMLKDRRGSFTHDRSPLTQS